MRNLQKILALALALIMSFSLVVTANAAFSDEADITDTYNEAVNVLSTLEVFKGYTDGTYQPQKSITRAEVAAIIYRIATGDVTDTQVSIYSDWNRFTDVHAGEWWAGYINYCANAEYIKGYGNGKFGPDDPVTGYEALAMILRAVGYGKMDGEFQGSDWAVQTAARASTLKVTKNVQNSALLNSPATRELVAELLFRSILVPTVEYNQFSGYTENDTNLGANLGLEAVRGVVVANEEADLYSEEVLAEGKTNLEIAENDIRTLDITSTLDDIGESRYAYIVGSKVLALGDTGENIKFENGEGKDIGTDSKFSKVSGLTKTDDTEFYLDFGREGHFSCDQRLEFQVIFYTREALKSFDDYEDISKVAAQNRDDWTVTYKYDDSGSPAPGSNQTATANEAKTGFTQFDKNDTDGTLATNYPVIFNRIIRANEEITQEEMNILEGIFAAADNDPVNGKAKDKLTGDVYVGTKSTTVATDEERDISNTISFRKFKADYINSEAWDRDFGEVKRGEWLKIIDNDKDGKADYAFRTRYWLDETTGTYTKSGETKYEYETLDVEDWDVVDYNDYDPAVGDVVLCTKIDGKVTIAKAEVLTDKIQTVSFRDETVTTVGGETKNQSEIINDTRMDETIINMEDGVEYNMYLDRYGNIRAYELAAGTKYALITELYYERALNNQYVNSEDLIVELKAGEAKVDEFDVLNSKDNDFRLTNIRNNTGTDGEAMDNWNNLFNNDEFDAISNSWKGAYETFGGRESDRLRVVLQPAINHLATEYQDHGKNSADSIFVNASTNVARYVQTDDGVRITTAAQRATDKTSNEYLYYGWNETNDRIDYTARLTAKEWIDKNYENGDGFTSDYPAVTNPTTWRDIPEDFVVYRYDYIELDCTDGIEADQRHYDISARDDRYRGDATDYIDAVHDTEYYIVNRNSQTIDYFTDYENVKKIDKDYIEAVYAVAENTESDNNSKDYWVANVIVIEVSNWVGDIDNIALVFDNYQQTSQRVKYLDTLATKADKVPNHVVPADEEWGAKWGNINPGFFRLYDTEKDGDELMADTLTQITRGDYGKYGIHAGLVTRTAEVERRGGYIDVDMQDNDWSDTTGGTTSTLTPGKAFIPDGGITDIYAIDGDEAEGGKRVSAKVDSGDIRKGDAIIWVTEKEDPESKTIFMVIVSGKGDDGHDHDWETPSWLWDEYYEIIREQRTPDAPADSEYTITISATDADKDKFTGITADVSANWVTKVAKESYTLKSTSAAGSATLTVVPTGGYEVESLTVAAGDSTKGTIQDLGDGKYLLYNVTADLTLDLTMSASPATGLIKVTVPANASISVEWTDPDGNAGTVITATNTSKPAGGDLGLVGTTVTVTVTPDAGYTYAGESPATYTLTSAGLTIAPTVDDITYTAKVNGTEVAGFTALNYGDKLGQAGPVEVTIPVEAGKDFTVDSVTVNGHELVLGTHYTVGAGKVTFPNTAPNTNITVASDIEIEVTYSDATYDLTITTDGTTGTVSVLVKHEDGTDDTYTANATDVLKKGDVVTVTATKGDATTYTVNGATVTAADVYADPNVWKGTVDGIAGAGGTTDITVVLSK